jgi:hypothetical protein
MALIPGTLQAGTKYPNEPQALLDLFASYLTAPEVKKNRPIVTVYTPAGGSTINFNTSKVDETAFFNHDPAITGLTLGFPSDGNSVVGQVLRVLPRTAVDATVTYSATGLTFYGATAQPTSFTAGTPYAWVKVAANTWFRLQ